MGGDVLGMHSIMNKSSIFHHLLVLLPRPLGEAPLVGDVDLEGAGGAKEGEERERRRMETGKTITMKSTIPYSPTPTPN